MKFKHAEIKSFAQGHSLLHNSFSSSSILFPFGVVKRQQGDHFNVITVNFYVLLHETCFYIFHILIKIQLLVGLGMYCHLELAINPFIEKGPLGTTV